MSKNNKASNYNEKMLTRLRIQFIVLSMAVVIIMQGFIVYTSVRNTYNKMVAKSDHLVSSIYINILDKKPIKADARYFYITFGKDNRPRTINIDNISDISEDEALAIYYEAYDDSISETAVFLTSSIILLRSTNTAIVRFSFSYMQYL